MMISRLAYKPKDYECFGINRPTLLEDPNEYEYGQGNTMSKMLKIWPLRVSINVNFSQVKVL